MIKIQNRLSYFLIIFSIFLLTYKLSFLSIVIGTIISIPIIKLFEHFNIYKYKLTKVIILILSILLLTYYLNKVTYFISDNILREYSIISITFSLLLSIFTLGNKGYHTIIKVIIISSYFILFTSILGLILLIPYINITNINISILTFNNIFINTITYVLLIVYSYFLIYPVTKTKFKIKDLIISNIINLISILLINSILNILTNYLQYPYVTIFKKVNLIGFIDRVEIIFSMNYLFIFYFLLLIIYYQIFFILKNTLKKKQLNISLSIISFIIFLFSLIL